MLSTNIEVKPILASLREELKCQTRIRVFESLYVILMAILLAVGSVAFAVWTVEQHAYWLLPLAYLLLAAVQHRLSIVQHDAIHKNVFDSKVINDVFVLYPFSGALLIRANRTQFDHLCHHAYLGTEKDGEQRGFMNQPKTFRQLVFWSLKKLLMIDAFKRTLEVLVSACSLSRRRRQRSTDQHKDGPAQLKDSGAKASKDFFAIILVQGMIMAFFAFTVGVRYYLWFWILPILTVTRFVVGIRTISEHRERPGQESTQLRYLNSIYCGWVERFIFGPFGFNYHAEHHMFPKIPTWRLRHIVPRLSNKADFVRQVRKFKSYEQSIMKGMLGE